VRWLCSVGALEFRGAKATAQEDSNIYAANFRDRPLALQNLIDGLDVD
jgi:hypothetical protein